MSTLQGRSLADTYKDLLQVSNSNIGVDETIRYVEDGEGTASALSISTSKVGVGINDWATNEVFNVQGDSLITGNLNVTGNILSNNGTVITTNNELAALGNVSIAQPTDGQILKYSGTTNQWTPSDDIVTSYWSPAGTNDIYRFTGNVGIGTTNPLKPLHIAAEGHHIVIEDTNSSQETKYRGIYNNNQDLHMGRYDNSLGSFTSDVVINEIGNVGIGNTDPAVNLHIGTTTSESQWIRLGTQYGDFSIGNGSHNTPPVKYFSIYDNDVAQHRLFLSDNGDIGFGTTSPSARLHAYSFDSDSDLRLERGDNGQIVRIDQNSIRTMGATPLTIFTNSTGTNGLHIASDGDIGFSTVNPIHALELFGKGKRFALTSDHPDGTRINHVELASDGAGHGYTIIYNDVGNPMARIHSTGTSYFNGGNVGIGTTNPEVDLHIKSTSAHGQSTLKLQGGLTGGYTSAIIFTNSDQTDNGAIYYNADDNFMRFNTGGLGLATEQMRITSSGDVGIGTDTPDNMLHVSGTGHTKVLTEGGSNNAVGFQMAQNLIDPGDGSVSPQIWQLQTQAGARNLQIRNATLNTIPLHIDGTAVKVGIGTTDPLTTLNVVGNHGIGDGVAFFKNESTDFGMGVKIQAGGSVDNERFALSVNDVAGNNLLFVQSKTGNVGIGTASPTSPFHVEGTGARIAISNSAGNTRAYPGYISGGDDGQAYYYDSTNNEKIRLNTRGASFFTGGNVGIGTTNPVHVLEVATPNGKYGHHVVAADAITSLGGLFSSASVDGGGLELYLKQPGETKVRITSNSTRPTYFNAGVVSIGTTTPPNVKFSVVGSLQAIYGYRTTTSPDHDLMTLHSNVGSTPATKFKVEADGDVWSSSSTYSSDVRLKTQIDELKHGVDTLNQLQPKQYKMIGSESKGFKYGFVAQEIETVLPDLIRDVQVNNDEDGVYKALDYNSIIAVLTKAAQEQQTMIDELKTQNQSLINRIETLENK